jgi:hypothetical protein
MIGVIPFVYMTIAYCIYRITLLLQSKVRTHTAKRYIPLVVSCGLLLIIFILNFYNYFYVYPKTLPNGNTPFGKLIAETIDASNPATNVVIIGSGWGQYVQPEVAGILMVQKTVHPVSFFDKVQQAQKSLCKFKQAGTPILIASNPAFENELQSANLCITKTKSHMLRSNGWDIAYIIEGAQ